MRALALAALLALPAHAWTDDAATPLGDTWPFGAAAQQSGFRGLDLYNLGLLGAKAGDAEVPRKVPGPMQGGRQRREVERGGHDHGPLRLRVDIVLPEGPAAKADLRADDVIVGVGGRPFKESSLAELAEALRKAEAGGSKGVVTLLVERQKVRGRTKIKVPLPQGGKAAKRPTEGAGRERLIAPALAWLADQQDGGGGFRQTLSGTNGAVVRVALAGLAWLGGGSDLEQGPYKDKIERAVTFIESNLSRMGGRMPTGEGGASWDQSNWGYAHAAIFLGELWRRTPNEQVRDLLHACGKQLAETQEASGGWAHGPGGPNALDYLELNIVSGLALCGLGMARQAGWELPESVVEKADTYLTLSGAGGGISYSAANNSGGNIGRTAGCWLGYLALGHGKSALGKRMAAYVKRNAGRVLGGHASLMQHILLAGVAAEAQGGAARKAYWKTAERDLLLARSPDGSFQPRPWHESKNSTNSDVTFGEVWTTAAWACVLVAPPSKDGKRPGLPAWTGKPPAK